MVPDMVDLKQIVVSTLLKVLPLLFDLVICKHVMIYQDLVIFQDLMIYKVIQGE